MRITVDVDIRFRDIDAMGHVNNAVYFNYFEQARIAFFNAIIGEKWDWNKLGIILVHNEIDYLLPVLLNDHLEVEVFGMEVGNKSFKMGYELFIIRSGKRTKCGEGYSTLVAFDYQNQKTIPIPEIWREKILD